MISILGLTQEQYADAIEAILGKGKEYARKVYRAWMLRGGVSGQELWIEPQAKQLVHKILQLTGMPSWHISHTQEVEEVCKFIVSYADGVELESVIIPMQFGYTLCVSSQVGCKMGCAFCETGKMGLIRSLSSAEIVAQLYIAKFVLQTPIRNIVFMGMGEPFDNYEAVMQAIAVMTDPAGLSIGHSKITVSTSGILEQMRRFTKEAHPALRLAVSLHAPTNQSRSKLMPINMQWNVEALKAAMLEYCSLHKRKILIEYVLLEGVNDSPETAEQVADYLQGLAVTINLIPYNAQRRGPFSAPQEEVTSQFRAHLLRRGYDVRLRHTKGRQIMAACGQLRTDTRKRCLRKAEEDV